MSIKYFESFSKGINVSGDNWRPFLLRCSIFLSILAEAGGGEVSGVDGGDMDSEGSLSGMMMLDKKYKTSVTSFKALSTETHWSRSRAIFR